MSHLGCACSQCFLLPWRWSVRFAISRNVWQIAKYSFPIFQLSNCSSRRRRLHRRSVSLYQRLRGRYPPVEQERENNMREDRLKDFQKRKEITDRKTDEDHQIMKCTTMVQCSENRELLWIAIYTSNAAILSAHSTFVASEERRRNQTLRINCTWSENRKKCNIVTSIF